MQFLLGPWRLRMRHLPSYEQVVRGVPHNMLDERSVGHDYCNCHCGNVQYSSGMASSYRSRGLILSYDHELKRSWE